MGTKREKHVLSMTTTLENTRKPKKCVALLTLSKRIKEVDHKCNLW